MEPLIGRDGELVPRSEDPENRELRLSLDRLPHYL